MHLHSLALFFCSSIRVMLVILLKWQYSSTSITRKCGPARHVVSCSTKVVHVPVCYFITMDTNRLLPKQSAGRVSCHICGDRTFQDDRLFYPLPDRLLAAVLWHHLDSFSRCLVPSPDHASSSCEAVLPPKAFQRCASYRFGCSRIRRVASIAIQSSHSKLIHSLQHL